MNEPRKLLMRKIDHAFAQQRYPLFFGISGMGKHAAAKAYAAKHNLACKTLIDELPVALECELIRINEDGNVIGRIVNVSVDESVLGADGGIDFAKFRPIAFEPAHSAYHVLGEKVGDAFRDGGKLK